MSILGNIIFDMDGTLIDSMDHHAIAFSKILKKRYSVPEAFARREYYMTAGSALDDQFQHALSSYYEKQVADICDLVKDFWNRVSRIPPKLMTSVSHTVPRLAEAGYNLFLTSGCRPDVVQYRMSHANLDRYFLLMLGADQSDIELKKGDPHFKLFRKHLKLSEYRFRVNTMMVGDGVHDMQLGTRAGFFTVGLESSVGKKQLLDAGADLVISKVGELLEILSNVIEDNRQFKPISSLWEDLKT